jgi:hypothetical protein
MKQSELIKKLENHPILKSFKEIVGTQNVILTGGAIVDILDGRNPKDYDFIGVNTLHQQKFVDAGYVLYSDTRTAKTFKNNGIVVQFLKTKVEEFDYTISQGKFNLSTQKLSYFDWVSYDSRTLVCVNLDDTRNVYDALMRLPHWYAKRFKIVPASYKSMLRFIKNPPNNYNEQS